MKCTIKQIIIGNNHAQPMFAFSELAGPMALSSSERLFVSDIMLLLCYIETFYTYTLIENIFTIHCLGKLTTKRDNTR